MHALTRQFLLSQITLVEHQVAAIKQILLQTPDETGHVLRSKPQSRNNAAQEQHALDEEIGKMFADFQTKELPPLDVEPSEVVV